MTDGARANCGRCQGQMHVITVGDNEATLDMSRCLNCGEVVDPLIVEHREHPPSKPYGTVYDSPLPIRCRLRRAP